MPESHSKEQYCLVCGCTAKTNDVQPGQHLMAQGYLCEDCDMELGLEFYWEESHYFEMASQTTGLDVWECKKRYLKEIVARIQKLLASNDPDVDVEHREWNLEQCQKQINAIAEYQGKYSNELDEALAYHKLEKIMQTKAFGFDIVIPGLITIAID